MDMTTSDIVWEDPPDPGRRRTSRDWAAIEAELRAHPGKWALVWENVKSAGHAGHRRTMFRTMGFDVRSAKRDDGLFNVYVRWPEA